MKKVKLALLLSAITGLSTSVLAAPGDAVDVADVVGTIGAQLVPIGLVGAAVLGVVVAVKAYKWIARGI